MHPSLYQVGVMLWASIYLILSAISASLQYSNIWELQFKMIHWSSCVLCTDLMPTWKASDLVYLVMQLMLSPFRKWGCSHSLQLHPHWHELLFCGEGVRFWSLVIFKDSVSPHLWAWGRRQLESVTDSTCSKAHITSGFRLAARSHTCVQEESCWLHSLLKLL